MEHCTLCQLRNCLHHTNVLNTPIQYFDACEEFFILVEAHIVTAAMYVLGMETMSDIPSTQFVLCGESTWMLIDMKRKKILHTILDVIVELFVPVSYNSIAVLTIDVDGDQVKSYAKQILTLGFLYMEFRDAIREGDGGRVLLCYRYLPPNWQNSWRKNYATETLSFLVQYDFLLSECKAQELIWSCLIK